MENASKALIIVGAVLIAILLIGFGVMIMNNSTSQVSPDALNSQAAQTHNAQFNNYTGKTISAQQVKTLMNIITTNNVTGATADEPQRVYVYFVPEGTNKDKVIGNTEGYYDPAQISSATRNGFTYTVEVKNSNAAEVTDKETTDYTGTKPGGKDDKDAASYYTNGYLRVIHITENKRGSSAST